MKSTSEVGSVPLADGGDDKSPTDHTQTHSTRGRCPLLHVAFAGKLAISVLSIQVNIFHLLLTISNDSCCLLFVRREQTVSR